jgi:hypothetical protein
LRAALGAYIVVAPLTTKQATTMKTVKEEVTGPVSVWALPTTEWERKNDVNLGFFKYCIRTDTPYIRGSVKVHDYTIRVQVPEGIDLLQRAIATLMEQKDAVLGAAQKEATDIQQQINSLLLLGGPTEQPSDIVLQATEVVECNYPMDCNCPECKVSKSFADDCPL